MMKHFGIGLPVVSAPGFPAVSVTAHESGGAEGAAREGDTIVVGDRADTARLSRRV